MRKKGTKEKINYLTVTEAGERLGVSRRRVQALITAGRLPAEKFGRDWVIRESDLAAVADRKTGAPKGNKNWQGTKGDQ